MRQSLGAIPLCLVEPRVPEVMGRNMGLGQTGHLRATLEARESTGTCPQPARLPLVPLRLLLDHKAPARTSPRTLDL